jgi:starch synthase
LLNGGHVENVRVSGAARFTNVRFWYSDAAGAPAYLLEAPEFFARPSIYGYNDDHIRFAFFSRAALALLKHLDWQPDVVHGNDWPCGFAMAELRARRRYERSSKRRRRCFHFTTSPIRDCLTPAISGGSASAIRLRATTSCSIARLRFEGRNHARRRALDREPRYARRFKRRNRATASTGFCARAAIVWRESPTASITTLESRKPIRTSRQTFRDDLSGKRECKIDLLRRFGLPENRSDRLSRSSRDLVGQKGYDLIRQLSAPILETGAFFIALGAGAKSTKTFCSAGTTRAKAGRYLQRLRRRAAGTSDRSRRRHVSHAVVL